MRKILIILALLLAALLAVAAYLVMNIDSVVHSRIERTGSRIAGVPVTVGSVDISLAQGTATVTDLVVANPPGFSDQPVLRFSEISATIKLPSGVVTRVYAGQPSIRVEGSARRTNLDVLRGNAAPGTDGAGAAAGESAGGAGDTGGAEGGGGQAGEQADDDESSQTYVIERIEIEQAVAMVDLEEMDEPEQLTIDEFVFTDLDGTRSQITRELLRQLTDAVLAAVRKRVGEIATEAARGELEQRARERLKDLLNEN